MRPITVTWLVAALAIGWRVIGIADWPSPVYRTLQYESAMAARAAAVDLFPASSTDAAREWRSIVGTQLYVAPPILPGLVALVDAEEPWVSRVFTIAFWMLAGVVIRRTLRRQTGSEWAAAAGFAWFVLNPFGMILSRSFQTESLLALAFAVGIDLLSRPLEALCWRRTLILGAACGAIAFVKPGILFLPLIGGFAGAILPRRVPGSMLSKGLHTVCFTVLACGPGTAYATMLLKAHGSRLMPELLIESWYWQGLWWNIREVIGPAVVAIGLAGVFMSARAGTFLLTGLLAGHLLTMAVFTYHAATHDYYQVPLMVIAAVALGPPIAWLERRQWVHTRRMRLLLPPTIAIGIGLWMWIERDPAVGPFRLLSENRAELERDAKERARHAGRAEAVRRFIRPHEMVIELTESYGYPLRWHGWVQTARWPSVEERGFMALSGATPQTFSTDEHLDRLIRETGARHFVVSDWAEWSRQPELHSRLAGWTRIEPCEGIAIFVRP